MTSNAARQPAYLPPSRPALIAAAAMAGVLLVIAAAVALSEAVNMSRGEFVIITLRVLLPLLILRWWLAGGILAMLIDATDVILIEIIGMGGFGDHYAELDKLLDSWYLLLEAWVAFSWTNQWAKWTAVALYAYRVLGVVLFEAIGARILLFIFPNLFENWWLYCVIVMKWRPSLAPSGWKSTLIPLLGLLVPKMAQEYLLHFAEAKPWNWTKEQLGL
jgi:hypothetical protein